jgi:hypothetical protein
MLQPFSQPVITGCRGVSGLDRSWAYDFWPMSFPSHRNMRCTHQNRCRTASYGQLFWLEAPPNISRKCQRRMLPRACSSGELI